MNMRLSTHARGLGDPERLRYIARVHLYDGIDTLDFQENEARRHTNLLPRVDSTDIKDRAASNMTPKPRQRLRPLGDWVEGIPSIAVESPSICAYCPSELFPVYSFFLIFSHNVCVFSFGGKAF